MNKRRLKKLIKKSNVLNIYCYLGGKARTKSQDVTIHKYGISIECCEYIPYKFVRRIIAV